MRIPLTRYAILEIVLFTAIFGAAAVLAWKVHPALAIAPALLLVFTISFFRDPERRIPGDESTIVSPADGVVSDIIEVAEAPFVGARAWRVGIFLSVFDVHVNRVPLAGTVRHKSRRVGLFLDARDEACTTENEAAEIGLESPRVTGDPARLLVRQITGLIARRIVCPVSVGDTFARGQRYGMIKFGSRTEVFVADRDLEELMVKVGDRVKGGASVLGRLRSAASREKAAS